MLHGVVWLKYTNISEEYTTSNFRFEAACFLLIFDLFSTLKMEAVCFSVTAVEFLPDYTVPYL
jgi:hypothetical protein